MSQKTGRITHEGTLDLNGLHIPCFVLEDGTRVLSGRGFQEAIRIRDKPEEGEKRGGYILPKFFESKAFKPLIDSKLGVANFDPILCFKGNMRYHGYEATVLADVCDSILEARKQGIKMTERQQIVANQCEVLMRSLAKVGIIALVDEATGYQYEREHNELQKVLKFYISEELLEWQKRFPDEFYKEIFRLNNWGGFTVSGIKAHQRPGVIGTWTKKLIYKQLPKGVIQELYNKTPKNSSGKLAKKLHQSITMDVGHPHLEKQLVSVITLMNISSNWKEFMRFFNKKFGQQEIEFGSTEQRDMIEPKDKPITKEDFNKSLGGLLNVPPPPKDDKGSKPDDNEPDDADEEQPKPKK